MAAESPAPIPPSDLVALATRYEHGEGVPKDPLRAAELYCAAARDGDAEARYRLGWMYANGRGLPRDDATAGALFALAARQGHEHARRMLARTGEPANQLPACMSVRETEDLPTAIAAATPAEEPEEVVVASPQKDYIVALVTRLAPQYSVDPRLALSVIAIESAFEPKATSPKNAQGLMQLIPETAERFGVRDAYDPTQNIRGGLAYLRWLLAYFRGSVPLVAAGYNAGEGAVDRYRGIPPYAETQLYVRRLLNLYKKTTHAFDARAADVSPLLGTLRSR